VATSGGGGAASVADSSAAVAEADSAPLDQPDAAVAAPAEATATGDPAGLDPEWLSLSEQEEETVLARTLAQTSWIRFGLLLGLLALVSKAFVAKREGLRWITLGATVALLGFSGGFLSVSHITSVIKVGPSVFLEDLPLLVLVSFTLVTTLLWGRIFCGYLCPFGALQDVLERIVPKRFRRELPPWIHDRALWIKYGILALILIPAAAGSQASIFQYFEPFGTVFFFSSSVVLWAIAIGLLTASAVVPRFYCRYACPLGAALAIASKAAPFRIDRVEQCHYCKVCENKCPTGAIRGPDIDFKECVRCNVCEIQLIEKHGVCKHDMEAIRPRLIQLKVAAR
jgi:polyferredoxin